MIRRGGVFSRKDFFFSLAALLLPGEVVVSDNQIGTQCQMRGIFKAFDASVLPEPARIENMGERDVQYGRSALIRVFSFRRGQAEAQGIQPGDRALSGQAGSIVSRRSSSEIFSVTAYSVHAGKNGKNGR